MAETNATSNKIDASGVPAPAPEPERGRIVRVLSLCGYALGPASLVNYLGQLFLPRQFSTQYLITIDIVTFAITFLLLLNLPWRSLIRFLPQALCLVMAVVLLIPFLRDANLWKLSPAVTWSRNLIRHLPVKCPAQEPPYLSDPCIIQQLSSFSGSVPGKLVDDLRIGETLLSDPRMADVLDRCYGVKKDLSGTGLSVPDFAKGDYSLARIPEYWVPNKSDSDEAVWTWEIDPQSAVRNKTLQEVLEKETQVINHNSTTFEAELSKNAVQLTPDAKSPALVRFAQFPSYKYHNHIGQDDSKLVFASHLGELIRLRLSLSDAASYSGRSIRESDPSDRLFIWVIFPRSDREVSPATWHNLLTSIAEDAAHNKPSVCKH